MELELKKGVRSNFDSLFIIVSLEASRLRSSHKKARCKTKPIILAPPQGLEP